MYLDVFHSATVSRSSSQEGYWQFTVNGLKIGNKTIACHGCLVKYGDAEVTPNDGLVRFRNDTVDGSEILLTTWNVENLVINGISTTYLNWCWISSINSSK